MWTVLVQSTLLPPEHPATALPWKHAEVHFQDELRSFPQVTMLNPLPSSSTRRRGSAWPSPVSLDGPGVQGEAARVVLCTPQGKSWEPRGAGSFEERGGVDAWGWPVRSQGPSSPGRWHPHVLPGGGGCLAQGRAHRHPEQARPLPSFGGLGTHTAASGFRGTRRQTSPCFLNRTASPACDLFPDGQASGRHRGWPAAPLGAPPQGWALLPRVRPGPRAFCS